VWQPAPEHPRADLVRFATGFVGTPYRWGGADPSGFDCSGLIAYVYGRHGVRMAHYTGDQFAAYPRVAREDLEPGDLVFFDGVGHAGIYAGDGRFVHATHSGDVVRVTRMDEGWYRERYSGAVRPPLPSASGPSTRRSAGMRSASSAGSSA
jgi:cell wall-associated NlpC family hydrolase